MSCWYGHLLHPYDWRITNRCTAGIQCFDCMRYENGDYPPNYPVPMIPLHVEICTHAVFTYKATGRVETIEYLACDYPVGYSIWG